MNLTDREVRELTELGNAVVDGTLTDAQKVRLSGWLAESEEARRFYTRYIGLSASLFECASESQVEEADAPRFARMLELPARRWAFVALAAAACVVIGLGMNFFLLERTKPVATPVTSVVENFVARLTGQKDCLWTQPGDALKPGDHLRRGQRLELAQGVAEITFDSGALVVLKGPASLEVNSAWDATLWRGTLKASVPPEAIGFRISNPAVEVVDLGTEFTMIADANGAAEVLVLKGAVEAAPRAPADQTAIVLREKESRRFASTGLADVTDREEKFARFTQPLPLDRGTQETNYIHWSFDEADGNVLHADAFGQPLPAFDARLEFNSDASPNHLRTGGRWQRALQFDGRLFGKAPFPGLSGDSPHTVAFWVKVPEEAQLSEAYAMVAWGTSSRKLGSRPVHISWNRNPAEGAVGVLRTDFSAGFALGTTPLRDGRWHHVVVVFVPGGESGGDSPVQVKQYVDGRLESGAAASSTRRDYSAEFKRRKGESALNIVWLGCRLGSDGQRKDRFRGELDELFIADRALAPHEIVQLMRENNPSPTVLASLQRNIE